MSMFTNQNMKIRFTDDYERKMLDRSYCVMISPEYPVERKLTAIEYLARFIDIPEHKERIETLYNKEQNSRVKKHLKKALEGKLFGYLTDIFNDIENINQTIENEFTENQKTYRTEVNKEMNKNLPFMRYQAKF